MYRGLRHNFDQVLPANISQFKHWADRSYITADVKTDRRVLCLSVKLVASAQIVVQNWNAIWQIHGN